MLKGAADYTRVDPIQTSNFDDNIKTILDLTLIAQRSGQVIDKDSLGILLAGAKGGLDFEALSSALGSGMFTDVPVKISATELKEQLDREKALRDAIKIDEAKTYLTKNLFTKNGAFTTPAEGDEYTDAEIETILTPLGLKIQKDGDNVIVYNGNTAVLNLGKEVTEDRLKLLKTALIAGSEDEIYALFRRSNPEYTYESDVEVEEEFILD
jgi:phenylalanyl-tRNA synthetase beta subunit